MATDNIERLHELDIQKGKTIFASQVNAELNQLVARANNKASRTVDENILSSWTFNKGVVLGGTNPSTTAGSFYYDADSRTFKGRAGETLYTFQEITSFIDVNSYGTNATAFVNALTSNPNLIILVPNGTYNLTPTLAQVPTLLAGLKRFLAIGTINITLPVGNVALTNPITIASFYPANVGIQGNTPISLSGVTWHSTSGSAGNYSLTFNVSSVTGIETGQLARLTPTAGTGDFQVLQGAWLITNVDSVNSRITLKHTFTGGAFPTFTLSNATLLINTSTLTFTGCSGFLFGISEALKTFYQLSIVGDYNLATNTGTQGTYGLVSATNANVNIGTAGQADSRVCIHGFGEHGIYAPNASGGTLNQVVSTGNRLSGMCAEGATLKGDSIVCNGNGQYGVIATQGGVINTQNGNFSANGFHGVRADARGVVNAYGSTVRSNVNGTFLKDDLSSVLLRTESTPTFAGIQHPNPVYATTRTFSMNGNAYAKTPNGFFDVFAKGNKTVSLDRNGLNGLRIGLTLQAQTIYYLYLISHPSLCDGGYLLDTAQNLESYAMTVQNLLPYSESLEQWTLTDATVSPNDAIVRDPLGGFRYDKITEGSAGTAQVEQTFTTSNTTVTRTARVKKGSGLTWLRLAIAQSTNRVQAWFNLDTGAVGTVNSVGTASSPSATIESLPDGSYLISLTGTFASAPSLTFGASASADASTTRVNNSVYYLWGNQLVDGSNILPYQPTFATPFESQSITFNARQLNVLLRTDSSSNIMRDYLESWDFKANTFQKGAFAFVNFHATVADNLVGTATRASNVVTVNATNHGHQVGHRVYLTFASGITNNWFTVASVVNANSFTVASTGADVVSPVTATLQRRLIRKALNVQNVSYGVAGIYAINLISPAPDANYSLLGSSQNRSGADSLALVQFHWNGGFVAPTVNAFHVVVRNSSTAGAQDMTDNSIAVF